MTLNESQSTLEPAFSKTFSQEKADEKLIYFLVEACVPFNVLEHQPFKDYVASLNPRAKCISADTAGRRLGKIFDEMRKDKMDEIAQVTSKISLSTDCWTGRNTQQFAVVNCSYINDDWELVTDLLDLTPIRGRHTGARLSECFEEVVRDDFKIMNDRHGAVSLDNASNNNSMIVIYCRKTGLDTHIQVGCTSHSINLAVQIALETFKEAIDKYRNFARSIRSSPVLLERLEALYKEINGNLEGYRIVQIDCKTRFNSTAEMLRIAVGQKMQEPLKVRNIHIFDHFLFHISKLYRVFSNR